jgi:hypothetical protein
MGTCKEGMTMAELTTRQREDLRDSDFAYVDRSGERHLPIHDADHVRNAIARFDQTDFQSKTAKHAAATRIMAAAKRHDIEVDDTSDVAREARS